MDEAHEKLASDLRRACGGLIYYRVRLGQLLASNCYQTLPLQQEIADDGGHLLRKIDFDDPVDMHHHRHLLANIYLALLEEARELLSRVTKAHDDLLGSAILTGVLNLTESADASAYDQTTIYSRYRTAPNTIT